MHKLSRKQKTEKLKVKTGIKNQHKFFKMATVISDEAKILKENAEKVINFQFEQKRKSSIRVLSANTLKSDHRGKYFEQCDRKYIKNKKLELM